MPCWVLGCPPSSEADVPNVFVERWNGLFGKNWLLSGQWSNMSVELSAIGMGGSHGEPATL